MFTELDILGVLVSPMVAMMAAAWLIVTPITMIAARSRLLGRVWHPGLFSLCLYVIILSLIVLHCGEHP